MRVALVVPGGFDRPDCDGPPRVLPALHALAARLARRNEVHVMCTDQGPEPHTWFMLGASVHDIGRVPAARFASLRTLVRARRVRRALSGTVPFDLVHAFWVDGNGGAAALAARTLGLPFVASVGGGEVAWLPCIEYGNARSALARAKTRAVLASAAAVTVGSRHVRPLVPRRDVEIVPLGPDRMTFEAPVDRPGGPPFRLVHVADHNRVKDPSTLLQALQHLRGRGLDVTLDWLGRDTLAGAVDDEVRARGLTSVVRLHGERPQAEVASHLRSAHLHVLASRYESQSVAVLEAALAGLLTVGTGVGILADMAPSAAVVVPPRDPRALAGAVEQALVDAPRRFALARAAQAFARDHDADATARAFQTLYGRVLGSDR